MELKLKTAKLVIKTAKRNDIYEGDMPDSDTEIISEAVQLVEQALEAQEGGFENDAIDEIVELVQDEIGDPGDPSSDDDNDDTDRAKESEEVYSIIDDYDDKKVSQIVAALDDLDTEDLATIYEYESNNRDRKSLLSALDAIAEERVGEGGVDDSGDDDDDPAEQEIRAREGDDDDPEPDDNDDPAPEPWRGYSKRTQAEILKVLDRKEDEQLAAAYEFESENKGRKGILNALAKLAEERGAGDEPQEGDESGEESTEPKEGTEGSSDSDAGDESEDEAPEPRSQRRRASSESDEEAGDDPHYDELIQGVEDALERERLAVPQRPPEDRVEIPFDLTELSDRELRQHYAASRAYFARARYVASLEGRKASACGHIADEKRDELITSLPRIDEETKKEKTATLLKAQAEGDDTVKLWRRRQRKHGEVAAAMRDEADIYEKDLEALSRDWTMRDEERESQKTLSHGRKK